MSIFLLILYFFCNFWGKAWCKIHFYPNFHTAEKLFDITVFLVFPLPTLHSADKFYFEAFVFRALYYSKAFVFRVSFPTLYLRPSRAPAPASPGARLTLGAGVGEVGGDMGPGLEKSRNSWGYKGRVGKKRSFEGVPKQELRRSVSESIYMSCSLEYWKLKSRGL